MKCKTLNGVLQNTLNSLSSSKAEDLLDLKKLQDLMIILKDLKQNNSDKKRVITKVHRFFLKFLRIRYSNSIEESTRNNDNIKLLEKNLAEKIQNLEEEIRRNPQQTTPFNDWPGKIQKEFEESPEPNVQEILEKFYNLPAKIETSFVAYSSQIDSDNIRKVIDILKELNKKLEPLELSISEDLKSKFNWSRYNIQAYIEILEVRLDEKFVNFEALKEAKEEKKKSSDKSSENEGPLERFLKQESTNRNIQKYQEMYNSLEELSRTNPITLYTLFIEVFKDLEVEFRNLPKENGKIFEWGADENATLLEKIIINLDLPYQQLIKILEFPRTLETMDLPQCVLENEKSPDLIRSAHHSFIAGFLTTCKGIIEGIKQNNTDSK